MGDEQEYASLGLIQEARARIESYVHITPVLTCSSLDRLAARQLFFKAEIFQKTGSFKMRGAANAVFSLSDEQAARGFVTHSSGNHAAALAAAAALRGVPAYIVVPRDTPRIKQDAVLIYGGRLTLCEPTVEARERECARLQAETGAFFVPPYNSGLTICGQGTIALELLEQVPDLDAIIVPVSGGGMISGIAVAAKALRPGILIVAAEPSGANAAADVAASLAAGAPVALPRPDTICDGLQARLGSLTWPLVRDKVDAAVVVSDAEVVAAMRLCYERLKVVVEPSGAAGLAAALSPQFAAHPRLRSAARVAVVLCGGNADLEGRGFWRLWEPASGGSV